MAFLARLFGSGLRSDTATPIEPLAAGTAAIEDRRFAEALTHLSIALGRVTSGAQRAHVHNKRALAYMHLGDRELAVDAFVDALAADSRCVPAIVNVGNLLLEDGQIDEAAAHYEAALLIDDGYAPAHLNLGIAYKQLGRHAQAVRSFRRADRIETGAKRRFRSL